MRSQTQDKAQKLVKKLEQGLLNLLESGEWKSYLLTQSRFHKYSFYNTCLILHQYPDATRVAGYNKWQGLGRQVRQGEKAIWILAPLFSTRECEDENGEKESAKVLFGFKDVKVFDISQTDGEELPEIVSCLQGDDEGLIEHLLSFSQSNGVPVEFRGVLGGACGVCQFNGGKPVRISVDPLLSKLHQAKTLAHEIAHSLLHGADQYFGHAPRSLAELEAESVAFIVAQYFGLDTSSYSFPYIAGWQQQEDAIANLKASGCRIQKAASQIIDWIEARTAFPIAA
jgi:antirestriction protein ArdC